MSQKKRISKNQKDVMSQNESKNEIETKKLFQSLSSLDFNQLPIEQKEIIIKSIGLQKLQKQAALEYKKSKFDFEKEKNLWLSQYRSEATKREYNYKVNEFINWLEAKGVSLLEIDSKIAFEFIADINSKNFSNNYKNSIITGISSFLSFLVSIDVLEKNYFLKIKSKPKQERYTKGIENIPTENEIKDILELLKKQILSPKKNVSMSAKKIFVSIKILKNNGLRIGALDNMTINKDGNFKTTSKGKITIGTLDSESLKYLKLFFNFSSGTLKELKINKNPLTDFFKKYKYNFSSHSFRHYFSINHYEKYGDIYKLSRILNHSNIGITGSYLSSLNLDITKQKEAKKENENLNYDVKDFNEIEKSLQKIEKQKEIQDKEALTKRKKMSLDTVKNLIKDKNKL